MKLRLGLAVVAVGLGVIGAAGVASAEILDRSGANGGRMAWDAAVAPDGVLFVKESGAGPASDATRAQFLQNTDASSQPRANLWGRTADKTVTATRKQFREMIQTVADKAYSVGYAKGMRDAKAGQ